jgi:predicted ester cyclase
LQLFVEAFPDHHIEVLDMAIEDDVGAFRTRHTGTHEEEFMGIPASGRRIDFESAQFSHYDDEGKIVEGWTYSDNLEFMHQLVVEAMCAVAQLDVPLVVDTASGSTWFDAQKH